jgi:integrase
MKHGYPYRRGKVWAVAIPDPNQKGGYKYKSGFATKGRASEYLAQRRDLIGNLQANLSGKGDVAYKTYFKEYLKYAAENFSEETLKTYKGVLKNFLMFADKKYPHIQRLYELRVKMFEDYKIWLKDTKHKDNTVNNHIKTFKTIFNVAIKWEYLDKNPLENVSRINVRDEKPIVTCNTPEKLALFFRRCKELKPEYYPHYRCAAKLGLRFGEMVTLEWTDIDFKYNVVRISRKEAFNPKGRNKKDNKPKERIIPMPSDVKELLSTLPRKHKKVFLKKGKPIGRKDQSFRRWISAIVKGTELEGMTRFHELRHTTGDILGLSHSIYDIKAFLGHSDIRTTERYVRVSDEAKKRMAETLGKFGETIQTTIQE